MSYAASLSSLPDELKLSIATHVRGLQPSLFDYSKDDLLHLRLVSKKWNEIARPLFFEHVQLAALVPSDISSSQALERMSLIREVVVKFAIVRMSPTENLDTDEDTDEALESGVSKEDWALFSFMLDQLFAEMLRKTPNLVAANISTRVPRTGDFRISTYSLHTLLSLRHLTSVGLFDVSSHHGYLLGAQIVAGIPGLRSFSINGLSDTSYIQSVLQSHSEFDGYFARSQLTKVISEAKCLRKLHLVAPSLVNQPALDAFLPALTELSISGSSAGEKSAAYMANSCSGTLRSLRLDWNILREMSKATSVPYFAALEDLTILADTSDRMEAEDISIFRNAPNVQIVRISACAHGVSAALKALRGDYFPHLRTLCLSYYAKMQSKAELEEVTEFCKNKGIALEMKAEKGILEENGGLQQAMMQWFGEDLANQFMEDLQEEGYIDEFLQNL